MKNLFVLILYLLNIDFFKPYIIYKLCLNVINDKLKVKVEKIKREQENKKYIKKMVLINKNIINKNFDTNKF